MTIGLYHILFALILAMLVLLFLAPSIRRRRRPDPGCKTVSATVASKRTHTSRQAYCKTCAVQPGEITTSYYVTFYSDSGSALELTVPAEEASRLAVGQRGKLTYQGSKYLGFELTN